MSNEMDLFRMDERQRLAWLMANRGTVIAVGATWIGMIVHELLRGGTPVFLIVMVPVFAALRVVLYLFYSHASSSGDAGRGRGRWGLRARFFAAAVLLVAALLPLFSVEGLSGPRRFSSAWRLALEDPSWIVPLALAFLWPWPFLLVLRRARTRGGVAGWLRLVEPAAAALSALVVLWLPAVMFRFEMFLLWLMPIPARPEAGCYAAIAADGVWVLVWLAEALSPWPASAAVTPPWSSSGRAGR